MMTNNIRQEDIENAVNNFDSIPSITQLVDRKKQLKSFTEALQKIQSHSTGSTFFEWFGSPGIGKTQLIRMLREKVCQPQLIPHVFVDFNTIDAYQWASDPTLLLLYLAEKLKCNSSKLEEQVDIFQTSARQVEQIPEAYLSLTHQDRLYNRPEWLNNLQLVRDTFLSSLNELQEKDQYQPFVFFFDETENADQDLIAWIEEWIFSPLMQTNNNIIVWTARRQHRWARPEIQRLIIREQLEPFDEDGVRAQFEVSDLAPNLVEELFKKVIPITGGHPAANAVIISQGQQSISTANVESDMSLEKKLLQKIYEQFIDGRVLAGLQAEEKLACELLSLVRFFDASILRRILLKFNEKLFEKWEQSDFGILFEHIKVTQLLVWQNGFAIDPDFRYIICDYYRLCKPDIFKKINEEVIETYKEWLDRPVDNRSFFIIELLYHLAALQHVGKKVQLTSALKKQLPKYKKINDPVALNLALEKLAGEIENNTDDWLTGSQRKRMLKAIHKFKEDNNN